MTRLSAPARSFEDLSGPRGLPLLGNMHQIRLDRLHLILEGWAGQYGDIFRFRLGPRWFAVISDGTAIRHILLHRPDRFRRPRRLVSVVDEMHLNGVFSAEGDDWRRQRRIVTTALNHAHLLDFFPTLSMTIQRLQRRWECAARKKEPVDLCHDLMRFTVDVTMQLAFGIDANTLETPGPVIQRHLDKIFPVVHRRVNAAFPLWRYFRLPSDRALDRALSALEEEVGRMVQATRKRMEAEPQRRTTPAHFLDALLAAVEDGTTGFTDAEIFANVGTLLLAGEDTTANSIAWTIHYLAQHPDHFARARSEIDALIAPAPGLQSIEQTRDLPILDAICNEAMRLKPVAPLLIFETCQGSEIMGVHIPKNTTLMLLARRVMTRSENFADATRFDPDRWLGEATDNRNPHDRRAFIPFGAGPRLCPGRNLALLQMRAALTMLCRNFEFEILHREGREIREHLAFTMMPADLSLRLKLRDH